jgi:hypothetical protein
MVDIGNNAMSLPKRLGHGAISLLGHARDSVVESCW